MSFDRESIFGGQCRSDAARSYDRFIYDPVPRIVRQRPPFARILCGSRSPRGSKLASGFTAGTMAIIPAADEPLIYFARRRGGSRIHLDDSGGKSRSDSFEHCHNK